MYEDLVVQNGWDIFEETYWVEFLTFRLEGEGRKIFENWTLEDPSIRGDYQKVKKSFPGKFGVEDNVSHQFYIVNCRLLDQMRSVFPLTCYR